jgi:hypothetical protein
MATRAPLRPSPRIASSKLSVEKPMRPQPTLTAHTATTKYDTDPMVRGIRHALRGSTNYSRAPGYFA